MDRYFFHTEDADRHTDQRGVELSGWAEAQAEAVNVAAEMLRRAKGGFCQHPYWKLKVTDDTGLDLLVIEVNAVFSPAAR